MKRTMTTVLIVDAGITAIGAALFLAYGLTGPIVASIVALIMCFGVRYHHLGTQIFAFILVESVLVLWQLSQAANSCWIFAKICLALGFPGAFASLILNSLVGIPFVLGIALLGGYGLSKRKFKSEVRMTGIAPGGRR